MDTEHLESLMKLMRSHGVVELELGQGENHTRIRLAEALQTVPLTQQVVSSAVASSQASSAADDQLSHVKSPFVGTFYVAPSPGVKPYVGIGDKVHKGQVLCIVEAMKLMNEIKAECDGVIRKIFVENEDPVEFEQSLFGIDPT
ncbi:MAG: acetyl-CoA carboxylase biotin carboxyl carrier protein [Oligoflexales bacterium]